MDEAKIDQAVRDLVADYDRCDGYLSKAHVEKLFEKRQLTVEEITGVYHQLETLGISLEDEINGDEDAGIHGDEMPEKTNVALEGVYERPDVKLRGLGSRLLYADEEVELGRQMELGRRAERELEAGIQRTEEHDRIIERAKRAKETMTVANLRLVLHIARTYMGYSDLDLDDLFQEGVVGLMRAVDRYDHTLGYKFSTYATWWIRQTITRALADRGATIRLPVHVHDDIIRFKRALRLLAQTHPERRTSMAELTDELAWTIEKVHFIQQVSALVPSSLDEQVKGYDDLALIDTMASNIPSPEDELSRIQLARCIDNALNDLSERQRTVLRLRFGLKDSGNGATLEEIGRIFGLTRERIRQIEAKALRRLRHPSRSDVLRDFLDLSDDERREKADDA